MFKIEVVVISRDEAQEPYYLDEEFFTFSEAEAFIFQLNSDADGYDGVYSSSDCGGDCCHTHYEIEKVSYV